MRKNKWGILFFAFTEILIGTITLVAVVASLMRGASTKPLEVVIFVLATAIIAIGLGIGILRYNLTSYNLLIYFSSIIILSKVLIFGKIMVLNGALETAIPSSVKNIISVLYHGLLIFYFKQKPIRELFNKEANITK